MTKIYTKVGDGGTTLLNGKKVDKDSCQIETLGAFDALMASLDKVLYGLDILPEMEIHIGYLKTIQDMLKTLAGNVAGKVDIKQVIDVNWLEKVIDEIELDIYEFVRFSNPVAMDLDEARIRTRKVEREITKAMRENVVSDVGYAFINRLSDYFFVLAVYIDKKFN